MLLHQMHQNLPLLYHLCSSMSPYLLVGAKQLSLLLNLHHPHIQI